MKPRIELIARIYRAAGYDFMLVQAQAWHPAVIIGSLGYIVFLVALSFKKG